MEAHARAPEPLTAEGDMARNWQSWKEDFIIFMKLTGYINKPNEIRANLLKNRIGKVGIEAIQNMSFDNVQDKDNMDILIKKLENHFNPPKNEVMERYQFFTRSKKQNESIEQYVNALREKAKTCNFNDMTDSLIRDKVVLDTNDKILRKKLFEADNLDLLKLVAIYNDYNTNIEKMKQVTKENSVETNPSQNPSINNVRKCWRCAHQHPHKKCLAWGSKCTKCGDMNHFTHCCKGPKFMVNKNLLNPMQQTKVTSKKNNKLNNEADFAIKTTVKETECLPDIPTTSHKVVNSTVGNDTNFDFVMLNTPNKNSKLHCDDTTNLSRQLPKNTQYNYSYTTGVKPDGIVTDLYSGNKSNQTEQTPVTHANAVKSSNNFSHPFTKHNTSHGIYKPKNFQKKKQDEDPCVLS